MSKINGPKLAEWVRSHHRSLVRFVSGIVDSADAAEDIAHDVYLKFSGRDADAMTIEHPKAYLFTAARNAALDHVERQNVEWRHRQHCDRAGDIQSAEPSQEARVDSHHRVQLIAAALNELPPACRQAFVLNKLHGLDHRRIAQRLGVSVSMVEKHVMRALAHCRDRLREGKY